MKGTLIINGTGSKKDYVLKEFTKGLKTVSLDPNFVAQCGNFCFCEVERDTDAILLDGVKDIRELDWLIRAKKILVNSKNQNPFIMKKPLLIITVNNQDSAFFKNFQPLTINSKFRSVEDQHDLLSKSINSSSNHLN